LHGDGSVPLEAKGVGALPSSKIALRHFHEACSLTNLELHGIRR
jgi:hypothetical protein